MVGGYINNKGVKNMDRKSDKFFDSIDKIRNARIKMLEIKMEDYINLVGRKDETFEDFFKRKIV